MKIINLIILFDLFDFVCFSGDYILTGFGRDQAVKLCVTGALVTHKSIELRDSDKKYHLWSGSSVQLR
jgi:hypothetical protein